LKSICLFVFTCLIGFGAFSETKDSLIRFSDLSFSNEVEKATFVKYRDNVQNADIIDLFLAHYTKKEGYSSLKAHEQILDCVNELKKETSGLSEPKKVKAIYKYVHKRFFKLYRLQNSFSDIFEKGEYNCVSGSAMYAIVFQLMDIPYQIVEAPQHVYLFAYPNTHKILVESTIPVNGYFTFSPAYVEKFSNYLLETKMISEEEHSRSTPDQIFNKHYFASKGLTIQELAGIQYCNYNVFYIESNEFEKALEEIKKAYFLIPNERNRYILHSVLSHVVTNRNYKSENDVNNLNILCRLNNMNKNEVSDERIKYEFGRLAKEQLISNSDPVLFERSYHYLQSTLTDTTLKKEISFYFNYEMARIGLLKAKDDAFEMKYLEAAYIANPKHEDLHRMIMGYFSDRIEGSNDPDYIMKEIEIFSKKFDFMVSDERYNLVRSNCLLELAYQQFMLKNAGVGESYLDKFEKLVNENKTLVPTEKFVEKAYSTAATYYYKKGNTPKTKQMLKKGIEYAPNNFGLKIRLSQVH
jgi:hypothetical protein